MDGDTFYRAITLMNFTDQGVRHAKDTVKRYEAAAKLGKEYGVTFKSIHWTLGQYDMVIAGDVVEHQEKLKALALLEAMREHARRWVLVSIPLGKAWPQEEYKDNRFDAHRSHWSPGELRRLGFDVYKFRDEEMRPYGVGLLTQPGAPRFRRSRVWLRGLVHAIESRFPATRALHERLRGGPAGGPEP